MRERADIEAQLRGRDDLKLEVLLDIRDQNERIINLLDAGNAIAIAAVENERDRLLSEAGIQTS